MILCRSKDGTVERVLQTEEGLEYSYEQINDRERDLRQQYYLGSHGRRIRPAFSFAVQRTGSRPGVHGDGKRQGNLLQ